MSGELVADGAIIGLCGALLLAVVLFDGEQYLTRIVEKYPDPPERRFSIRFSVIGLVLVFGGIVLVLIALITR